MHYSENPGMCRFEFFKDTGKWYMTEAIDMSDYYTEMRPVEGVLKAWIKRCKDLNVEPHNNFNIVVSDPYHFAPYPVMLASGKYDVTGSHERDPKNWSR